MRKKVISIALLSLMAFATTAEALPLTAMQKPRANIEELIERRRWADAKFSLNDYRKQLDAVKDRYELEWVD
jgi:hypothetical protein